MRSLLVVLVALAALLVLNTFALNNETEPAELNVGGARLVGTTSGQIQVLESASSPQAPGAPNAEPGSPPVVLIHGSGGAINWWDELTPPLTSQGRQVIAVDMLGYGGSEKPSSGYEIETQANLLAQVLSRLGVEKAAVVGHSLGGKVATALAESSPDLVAGVVVLDTPPDSSYGSLGGGAKLARTPVIGQALWRLSPDFLVRRNLEQAFAPGFEVPEQFVGDIREMTYPAYRDSASESDAYTDEQPLDARLDETGLPLLVIFGEQDQLYPARESLSAYAAIPGAQTVLIPEAGHSPNVETPQQTAVTIGTFVDTLAPPRTGPRPEGSQGQAKGQSGNRKGRQNRKGSQGGNRKGQGQNRQNQSQEQNQQGQNRQPQGNSGNQSGGALGGKRGGNQSGE
jgi:pimeloyl-ACP methyl ester carboxylesterase